MLTIMLGAGLVLWIGVPLGWLYVGSQVQAATDSLGAAIATMMVGVVVSILAIVLALAWLNEKHARLQRARGRDAGGQVLLEGVMTLSVVVAVVAFVVWFFVIEGPGPSLAPSR